MAVTTALDPRRSFFEIDYLVGDKEISRVLLLIAPIKNYIYNDRII